jgi:hypothetical protein
MKIPRYPDRLASPVPRSESIAALDASMASDDLGQYVKWKKTKKLEGLSLLFKFYDIPHGKPGSWKRLAIKLAEKHVPGMRIHTILWPTKGRPRKAKQQRAVERPVKWTDESYQVLFFAVQDYVREHDLSGRTAIKIAIEQILRADAKSQGKSETKAAARVSYWQRRYSKAAARFRKLLE